MRSEGRTGGFLPMMDMFDDSIKMMNTIVGPLKESGFQGILISISNPADIIADFLRSGDPTGPASKERRLSQWAAAFFI